MRASAFWEAALVAMLIIVAVGAFSAWTVLKTRARKPPVAIQQPGGDAAVQKAVEAVRLYAPFALRINNEIYIDQTSIEKTPLVSKDCTPQWEVAGQAAGDSIEAANFRWIVQIAQGEKGPMVRQVQLNGNIVFSADER
jgi:hypothetical protein